MKGIRASAIASVILLTAVNSAGAQFESLSSLASNFSDLAIQWGPLFPRNGGIHPESDPSKNWVASYGAEFIFDIPAKKSDAACTKVVRGAPKERKIKNSGSATDSIDVYALKTDCPKSDLEMEFGFGIFQSARFINKGASGSVTGVLRETPTLSVYATWNKVVKPYAALRAGVTELAALSLEDASGRVFNASAPRSVEVGAIIGVAWKVPAIPLNIFIEGSPLMYRPFSGIRWESNKDDSTHPVAPPAAAIKRLDFTSRSVMLGFQVTVKPPDAK